MKSKNAKITKQVAALEAERKVFTNDLSTQRRAADQLQASVDSHTKIASNLTQDLDLLRAVTSPDKPDLLVGKQHIEGVGEKMLTTQKNIMTKGMHKIAIFHKKFELVLSVTKDFNFATRKDELVKKWEVKSENGIT